MHQVRAVLFDKDGTLFGFQESWAAWANETLASLSQGDPDLAHTLAEALRFDPVAQKFFPDSAVIAGTPDTICTLLAPVLPHWDEATLVAHINAAARNAKMVPAVPLRPLLQQLLDNGVVLGVATNDSEHAAHAHLKEAGIADMFAKVIGFDSGYGAKPGAGMVLAFVAHCGLAPEQVLMVGDSLHDLQAGRNAGVRTLAVLTGVATADDLAPYADAVRDDIGHLPILLGQQSQ
jgi:phosphoglycolate phosphatase